MAATTEISAARADPPASPVNSARIRCDQSQRHRHFGTVSIADIASRAHLQNKKRVLRWTADPRVVDRTCSVLLDRAEVAAAGTTARPVRLPTSQRQAEIKNAVLMAIGGFTDVSKSGRLF
jgi:hypothetical protein